MNIAEAVRGLAILRALEGIIKAEIDTGKAVVTELFTESGSDGAKAKLADGTYIAKVTLAEREGTRAITDAAAFEAYVRELYPEAWVQAHTETITREVPAGIDPACSEQVLSRLTRLEDGTYVDTETGATVPGVNYRRGAVYPSVRFQKGGKEAVAAAWRSGGIDALLGAPAVALPADGGDEQ